MAKRQALLFELMKEDEQPQGKKSIWDHFFRKNESGSVPAHGGMENGHSHPPMPSPTRQPESSVSNPTLAAPEIETGRTRMYLRINTYSMVLAGTVVLVVFFCGYILGKSAGLRQGTQTRSEIQLSEVRNKPAETEVLEVFSAPPAPAPQVNPPAVMPAAAENSLQMKDILQKEDKISRKTGLNYLIIQNFELDAVPIAELAKKFLADKGLQTTIERDGRSYKLISAIGFDYSDPQDKARAESFKAQIEVIGQEFKQLREAYGVSFKGCYYKKW